MTSRTISTTWSRGRKTVTSGDALVVTGLRGQVRFRRHVMLADGREYLDVVHPDFGFYSVRPERVGPIPRKSKLRTLAHIESLAVAS